MVKKSDKLISKEMEENIKNYGNQIEELEDFVSAVKKLVGMYIGKKGAPGFLNMIREIFQNSIDELNREFSPCNMVKVSYAESTNQVIIEDNGRGIPFNDIERIFTQQHVSSNYTKTEGNYTSGLNGVGSKVTNALSQYFIVESYILGEARRAEFKEGYLTEQGVQIIPNKENKQGTIVMFSPNNSIMDETDLSWQEVLNLVKKISMLTRIGSIIQFNSIDKTGKPYSETIVNEDGILTDIINKTASPLIKPITLSIDNGTMKADIAFTYDSNDLVGENITSFSNFCPTIGGTHIEGFLEGLTNYFRIYMNKIYLGEKSKLTVVNNDIKTGLKAVVAVSHLEPIFTGQAKEILSNEDMFDFVKFAVRNTLDEWCKSNSSDLQKLCKFYKGIAEVRVKSDEGKLKISKTYVASSLSGLPPKYIAPKGTAKDGLELWVVEGDSAAGSLRNNRDNVRQGIVPVKGKIPNAFTTPRQEFVNNKEISGILAIVSNGDVTNCGKNFDINKVPWEKLVISSDSDIDGHHIAALMLKFVILYMKPMLDNLRVYRATPPLYGTKMGKKKYKYFMEKMDYINFLQKDFFKSNIITNMKGEQLSNSQISEMLFNNINYVYELKSIADLYSLDYGLLEFVLFNMNDNPNTLRTKIKNQYRFLDLTVNNGTIIIKGLLNKCQTLVLSNKLIDECKEIINILNINKSLYYVLNNQPISLFYLMNAFEKSAPSSVERYKGLGEMDGKQLFESTVDPKSDRTLIQYTFDDAKKEIERLRYLESNRFKLLDCPLAKNVTRFDIMD